MSELETLEEDDRILFNKRKTPLTVTDVDSEAVYVSGPQGGEYELYQDEETETLLVCKKGNRRYSSYLTNLRKTGKWIQEDNRWHHTNTDAEIVLEKNDIGFWTIETNLDTSMIDVPKYGYSDREVAEEDVQKLVSKHPEGE